MQRKGPTVEWERFRSDPSEGCQDSGCLPTTVGVDSSGSLVKEMRKLRPRNPGGGISPRSCSKLLAKARRDPKRIL